MLDKNEHQKASKEITDKLGTETVDTFSKYRVSFSGSWATDKAEDITWASFMEPKRYPIVKSMLPHQRVSHFPRSYELTRKDRMYKNIERLQISKGPKHFNFIPKTFTIPNEFSEFAAAHHRTRGKGVFVILQ